MHVQASSDGKDEKLKREQAKADFSALWAQRVKNFMSGRRKYLQAADAGEDEATKKLNVELRETEAELAKQKRAEIEACRTELKKELGLDDQGLQRLGEDVLASDLAMAEQQL